MSCNVGHLGVGLKGRAMSLHVGQLVVCVNDAFSPCEYWRQAVQSLPKLHGVYTIRHTREAHGLIGLCFHEIRSPHAHFSEAMWNRLSTARTFARSSRPA